MIASSIPPLSEYHNPTTSYKKSIDCSRSSATMHQNVLHVNFYRKVTRVTEDRWQGEFSLPLRLSCWRNSCTGNLGDRLTHSNWAETTKKTSVVEVWPVWKRLECAYFLSRGDCFVQRQQPQFVSSQWLKNALGQFFAAVQEYWTWELHGQATHLESAPSKATRNDSAQIRFCRTDLDLECVPHVGNCWGVVGLVVFIFHLMQHFCFGGFANLQEKRECKPQNVNVRNKRKWAHLSHTCTQELHNHSAEANELQRTCSSKTAASIAQTISAASTRKTRHVYWNKETFSRFLAHWRKQKTRSLSRAKGRFEFALFSETPLTSWKAG